MQKAFVVIKSVCGMDFRVCHLVYGRFAVFAAMFLLAVSVCAQEPVGKSELATDVGRIDSMPSAFQDKLIHETYSPEFSVPLPENRFLTARSTG